MSSQYDRTGRGESLVEVAFESEPAFTTDRAQGNADRYAKHLGIPPHTIRWFVPVGRQTKCGQYIDGEPFVWLSIELANDPTELLKTIGHELHHALEYHRGHFPYDEIAAKEAEDRIVEWHQSETAKLSAAYKASCEARSLEIQSINEMREIARRAQESLKHTCFPGGHDDRQLNLP
jgi:hypothetical protein